MKEKLNIFCTKFGLLAFCFLPNILFGMKKYEDPMIEKFKMNKHEHNVYNKKIRLKLDKKLKSKESEKNDSTGTTRRSRRSQSLKVYYEPEYIKSSGAYTVLIFESKVQVLKEKTVLFELKRHNEIKIIDVKFSVKKHIILIGLESLTIIDINGPYVKQIIKKNILNDFQMILGGSVEDDYLAWIFCKYGTQYKVYAVNLANEGKINLDRKINVMFEHVLEHIPFKYVYNGKFLVFTFKNSLTHMYKASTGKLFLNENLGRTDAIPVDYEPKTGKIILYFNVSSEVCFMYLHEKKSQLQRLPDFCRRMSLTELQTFIYHEFKDKEKDLVWISLVDTEQQDQVNDLPTQIVSSNLNNSNNLEAQDNNFIQNASKKKKRTRVTNKLVTSKKVVKNDAHNKTIVLQEPETKRRKYK